MPAQVSWDRQSLLLMMNSSQRKKLFTRKGKLKRVFISEKEKGWELAWRDNETLAQLAR